MISVKHSAALVCVLIAIVIYYRTKQFFAFPEKPAVEDTWWGPGEPWATDSNITPFKINVSEDVLIDLQYKLEHRIPFEPPLEGAKQHYGMNTNLLNTIVEFWISKYDWRERETFLNQFPQFTVKIQGLNIHFIHVKPQQTERIKVIPLLLLHGWPGSVREFYKIIPMLTTSQEGRNIVFEVIIPSLPGYGFSDGAVRTGLGPIAVANVLKNLMIKLGFDRFYLQGGDWGSMIVQIMAAMFPENIIGVHSNLCLVFSPLQILKTIIGSYFPSLIGIPMEQEKFLYPLSEKSSFLMLETGYYHIQATKPDTVGVALRDSPVGLAAYILEKFCTGTNKDWNDLDDCNLLTKFTYTELLDNVMIYWVTRSMTTATRLYAEAIDKSTFNPGISRLPIEVPSGCARFSNEFVLLPDVILKDRFVNLVHLTDLQGGHFAAFEVPQVLSEDVFSFVEKVEKLSSNP